MRVRDRGIHLVGVGKYVIPGLSAYGLSYARGPLVGLTRLRMRCQSRVDVRGLVGLCGPGRHVVPVLGAGFRAITVASWEVPNADPSKSPTQEACFYAFRY